MVYHGLLVDTKADLVHAAVCSDNAAALDCLLAVSTFANWQDWMAHFEDRNILRGAIQTKKSEVSECIRQAIVNRSLKCLNLLLVSRGEKIPTNLGILLLEEKQRLWQMRQATIS